MIRNIVFDLGGVMVDLDEQRTLDAFRSLMPDAPLPLTAEGLVGGKAPEWIDRYQTGQISTETFLQQMLKGCKAGTTKEEVTKAWMVMLKGVQPAKRELLLALKQRGYRVYILSNINELHVQWTWQHIPELCEMDQVFFSNEIHLAKPDPRCYEWVMSHANIHSEETLYVDDLDANIQAGKAAGWTCLQAIGDQWMTQINQFL